MLHGVDGRNHGMEISCRSGGSRMKKSLACGGGGEMMAMDGTDGKAQ